MSDNIPFDIQMEIIKWLPVKPLIQFRSVSKPWKSFIDSSHFIKAYGVRQTQPHSHILTYRSAYFIDELSYICLVEDDNNGTFKVQQQESAPFVMCPLLKQYSKFVGMCHGLLCIYGYSHECRDKKMLVIWNPSIGKSVSIALRDYYPLLGLGVCPITRDPIVVKVCALSKAWHDEVFTLSSGVWHVIPSGNLPRQSIKLNSSGHVVIGRFIYWGACEKISTNDGESTTNHMVVSFDLITKEFLVVDLPDSLTNEIIQCVSVSKLRESLVVYGYIKAEEALCDVWVMERDSSFRKLFSICVPVIKIVGFTKSSKPNILGFTKSSKPIYESVSELRENTTLDVRGLLRYTMFKTLNIYDPCSQDIKNLGISGVEGSFFMDSYKESLLLLDHSDLHIYSYDSWSWSK